MTTPTQSVEFMRRTAGGDLDHAGNMVQLVDANGNPITVSNPLPSSVSLGASELHIGETGFAAIVTAPNVVLRTSGNATPYTVNQRVGPASGALAAELTGMARVTGGYGEIVGLRLSTNKKSITPRIRVHFFTVNNPTIVADNTDWKEMYADSANRIGFYDMANMTTAKDTTNSDCSRVQDFDIRLVYKCAVGSTSIYYAYETLDAFTPSDGESFSLVVKARLY